MYEPFIWFACLSRLDNCLLEDMYLVQKRVAGVLTSTHCAILVIPIAHFPNQNYYKCGGVLDDDNVSAAIRLYSICNKTQRQY